MEKILLVMVALLLACSEKKDSFEEPNYAEIVDFYEDIQPILENNCVACHNEEGQGLGDFTSYENVRMMAPLISASVHDGRMPPPVADPNCRDYKGSEVLHLAQEDKDLISKWIEQGMEEGDPSTALEYDRKTFELEDADLTVMMTEPYTPSFSSENNPGNEYRCFSIPHNRTEPFYITAVHPVIDNHELVHHVVIAKGDSEGIIIDSNRPEGKGCIRRGGAFIRNFEHGAMLSGWAPGMRPVELNKDAGMLVMPDEFIVVQVHYYQNPDAHKQSDQSGVAFRTTDSVDHVVQMFPLGTTDFTIPAGEEAYTVTDDITLPIGYKIWGIFPHMHVLGDAYSFSIGKGEEEKCLAKSDHYDFENQLTYIFHDEVEVPADTPFNISCTWNNSAENPNIIHNPPVDISNGERTDEEMCFGFTLVSFN
ncbi:MAG: hypothetical protein CL916_05115 [Deltaproteobacteria bacterium]|nr:hypothetical protein [Deltaproteobacteria bacterium]